MMDRQERQPVTAVVVAQPAKKQKIFEKIEVE